MMDDPANDTPYATAAPLTRPPARRGGMIAGGLLVALLLGAVGGGWAAVRWIQRDPAQAASVLGSNVAPAAPKASTSPASAATAPPADAPNVSAGQANMLAGRVAALEDRLTRISMAADTASGNAAKAEGLLVAFAARRALDRGLSLGGMEGQLRLRFGETQPRAVESIIAAAANPVTTDGLALRLDSMRGQLLRNASAGLWTRVRQSLTSLIVVRKEGDPSNNISQRFDRAHVALMNGRVDQAIRDVETLPGAASPDAAQWLTDARRFNDARRALDLIETAAVLEPGENRATDMAPTPEEAPTADVTGALAPADPMSPVTSRATSNSSLPSNSTIR